MAVNHGAAGLAAAAWVVVLAGACTPAPATDPASTSPASAGPTATSPSSIGPASPSPTATSPASPGTPSTSTPTGALTIDITVRGGQVTPNGKKFDVTRGQTVVLRVSSDAEEEVHAHTAGNGYELEVHPGKPARGQFVAADPGTFEVELHHLDKIVAILVVR